MRAKISSAQLRDRLVAR